MACTMRCRPLFLYIQPLELYLIVENAGSLFFQFAALACLYILFDVLYVSDMVNIATNKVYHTLIEQLPRHIALLWIVVAGKRCEVYLEQASIIVQFFVYIGSVVVV